MSATKQDASLVQLGRKPNDLMIDESGEVAHAQNSRRLVLDPPMSSPTPKPHLRSTSQSSTLYAHISSTDASQTIADKNLPGSEHGDDDESISHRSSICRSPVWDDEDRKREKRLKQMAQEKRKKEKERKMKQMPEIGSPKRRLVKPPPRERQSLMGFRTTSAPAIQSSPSSSLYETKARKPKIKTSANGSSQYLTENIRSSKDTASMLSSSSSTSFRMVNSTRASDGFIGGVKLRKAQNFATQIALQPNREETNSLSSNSSGHRYTKDKKLAGVRQSMDQANESHFSETIVKFTGHCETSTGKSTARYEISRQKLPSHSSIMDRGIKSSNITSSAAIDDGSFPGKILEDLSNVGDSSPRNAGMIRTSRKASEIARNQEEPDNQSLTPLRRWVASADGLPNSSREPAIISEQSMRGLPLLRSDIEEHPHLDQFQKGYDNQSTISSSKHSHGPRSRLRSWSITSFPRRSQYRLSSRPPTRDYSDNSTTASQLVLQETASRDKKETHLQQQSRYSAFSTISSFLNLKSAAKKAFSRQWDQPTTSSESESTATSIGLPRESGATLPHRPVTWNAAYTARQKRPDSISSSVPLSVDSSLTSFPLGTPSEAHHSRLTLNSAEDLSMRTVSTSATTPISTLEGNSYFGRHRFLSEPRLPPVTLEDKSINIQRDVGKDNLTSKVSLPHAPDSNLFILVNEDENETIGAACSTGNSARDSIEQSHHLGPSSQHRRQMSNQPNKGKTKEVASKNQEPSSRSTSLTPADPPILSDSKRHSSPASIPGQHLYQARLSANGLSKKRFPKIGAPTPISNIEPIAKMFVICCTCRYYHDMPSKLYERMASRDGVVDDRRLGVSGMVTTAVICPWCGHGMHTSCCEGYAGLVYLRERMH
ncbi:hypothetical protein B0O99DRAFT_684759 [Bisporella sp. PMI_857]|nr:hypothetical protein B0O99DRAFT_684759 [Bisporella sp. PMI_857]